jgi:hypothetical protein
VHFDGFHASIFFATFSAEYLRTLRDVNVGFLQNMPEKVQLYHTITWNLCHADSRTEFIKQFVALVRFVAAGEANIGFLGKYRTSIHRMEESRETPLRPSQMEMDEKEEVAWRIKAAGEYAD